MARDIMAAIVRAYEAQRLNVEGEPWAVKIYDNPDHLVFERLPGLAYSQKLYAHQHCRYYTMLTSDLFDLLEGDILARPASWRTTCAIGWSIAPPAMIPPMWSAT